MKISVILFFVMLGQVVSAQSVTVPSKMEFAGIKIYFNSAARKKVQYEVDKLRKSPTYFQKHVDQANLYFPLIEEVFKKKKFPLDFKYLIIQESAFNADAVSSSNAVGYWQFKEGTAKEVGMKVGEGIDERKNIYAASEGAANYMLKTNKKLDNWVYALLSYNVGPGGVMSYFKPKDKGVVKMEVTSKMHWYVMKMFAHKIAFQDAVGKEQTTMTLFPDFGYAGKNLKQISKTSSSTLESLEKYNRWISKSKKIPSDKKYAVIFPMKRGSSMPIVKEDNTVAKTPEKTNTTDVVVVAPMDYETPFDPNKNVTLDINHIPVISAKKGDYVGKLALKVDVQKQKFAKYNEIGVTTPLVPGMPYFTKKKKNKAIIAFYSVKPGENLWSIAQKYGVTMFSIRTKNRMTDNEPLVTGRLLYMRQVRPEFIPIKIKESVKKEAVVIQTKEDVPVFTTEKNAIKREGYSGPQEAREPRVVKVVEQKIEEPVKEIVKETVVVVEEVVAPVKKTEIAPVEDPIIYEPKATNGSIHVVASGETFYSISKKHKVSVDDIKKANKLSDLTLSIGQELIIPNVNNSDNKELSHTVKKGDTMYSIATKYGVKVLDLMKWNNKENTDVSLGETLNILQN